MSRAQRSANVIQDNFANRVKVEWPFNKENQLGPLPHKKKILEALSNIKDKDFKQFRNKTNDLVERIMDQTSPMHLRMGGFVIAVLLAILGVICMSLGEVAVGIVVVILAGMFAGMGFWYRGQLVIRAWKKIGQGLNSEIFKDFATKHAGVSCEFHVKGTHTLNRKARRKSKGKKQRNVFFERYIVLYLPGDASHFHEYTEDKRSVTQILKGDSAAIKERHDYIDDEPLILPYWWAVKKTADGKQYFINNLKHETSWNPPTAEQIEMEREELGEILAPPEDSDSESS